MAENDFQNNLEGKIPDKEIVKEIEADNEKEYLRELSKKNKGFLIDNISIWERERVGKWICERFNDVEKEHKELADKIDEWDEVYRMTRKEVVGSDGNMPNYRSPLSTVTLEVIHAMILNVFFTPKDIGRVLPTEEGDIPKVNKLSTFMNWSVKNELNMFENVDRLFHNSTKTGECPYIVHWVKEYGTVIKREMVRNPANPSEPLYDPDTEEPIFQEKEEEKLTYNGPRLEIFSRKDYFQPRNAMMGQIPPWEGRRLRMTYDSYLREELQGKMYKGSISDVTAWNPESSDSEDNQKIDFDGDDIPLGVYEQEFREFYGRMRINLVKKDAEDKLVDTEELEDEFIAIVHVPSQTLCQLRKNKFPLKKRPIGVDYFIPDDEGRRKALGAMEFLDSQQKAYDALWNQYIQGVIQANNPILFFTPTGNQRDEAIKLQNGFAYPTSDPNSIKLFNFPPPDQSTNITLELIQQWAQLLFGISGFTAGGESTIDPDAPAKKVEIIVARGNVRQNAIVKRKNKTIQDILERWFMLYKENLPPNKYMRIAGHAKTDPWKFTLMNLEDFALDSNPDFELTGNILNSNKSLEANKALSIYQLMAQNPFFSPQSQPGIQALHSLTKWLIDKLDETGLSSMLPEAPGESVQTPEEENARFLQGDIGEPSEGDDDVYHIRVHNKFILDPTVPEKLKPNVIDHQRKHIQRIQIKTTQQIVMSQAGIQGGGNGQPAGQGTQATPSPVVPGQPAGVGRF